jgi:dihydroneopterin aldolase
VTIHIQKLRFETILGILDFERENPQTVQIDCTLEYSRGFVDYAKVVALIKEQMHIRRFELIEEALEALAVKISEAYGEVETAEIRIMKPDILRDCEVGVSKKFNF